MPMTATLRGISSGTAGTLQTLKIMRKLIRAGRWNPQVIMLARQIASTVPPKDYAGELNALFYFVRDHIRYVRDTNDVEVLADPVATLTMGSGDCDDKVILLASLLEAAGHPTRLVAMKEVADEPYSHVYLESKLGSRWVPLETTENWPPGKAPPSQGTMVWYV